MFLIVFLSVWTTETLVSARVNAGLIPSKLITTDIITLSSNTATATQI